VEPVERLGDGEGAADLEITQIAVDSGAPVFALDGTDCGATLAPQTSCTVQVRFSPAELGPFSGVLRVAAENEWLALGEVTGVPVAILRLSGIYGPGRNAFVNLANGTAKRLIKPGQVFNRIHVADIAGALWHLADRNRGGVFNVTDDLPAAPQDVVTYAAELMGVEPPPEIPFASAQLSPMARSFYGENKRVSNAAIKERGYRFRYPDYRSAFDAMWAEGTWAGNGESDARSPMKRS
jgi:nucleoside-diphosphate-sugar epimerase